MDKYYKNLLSNIKDEKLRNDVDNIVRLYVSLSQHFEVTQDLTGKKQAKVPCKEMYAKKTISMLLEQPVGQQAYQILKEYSIKEKNGILVDKNFISRLEHSCDVCKYLNDKLNKIIAKTKQEEDEHI